MPVTLLTISERPLDLTLSLLNREERINLMVTLADGTKSLGANFRCGT